MPNKTSAHSIEFLSVDLAPVVSADGAKKEPPKEVRLFSKGKLSVNKLGEKNTPDFHFTDRSAEEVLRESKAWGIRHSMDWEHTALNKALGVVPPGDGRAPAACWYDIELREDGLYATNIEWTDQGASDVLSKAYKYISPAFDFDPETREVTSLWNASLTNLPATRNMQPIMASIHGEGANPKGASSMLKPALAMLGLAENTPESEALAKLSQLHTFRATVLATTGKATESEALGALTALKMAETKAVTLAAELETLKSSTAKNEVESLLTQGERDGKIEPGSELRTHLATMPAKAIQAFLSAAPVVKPGVKKPAKTDGAGTVEGGSGLAQLSAAQVAAAHKMAATMDVKVEDLLKTWTANINARHQSAE